MCVYVCKHVDFFIVFLNAVIFVSVCHGSIAVSDFFRLYLSI